MITEKKNLMAVMEFHGTNVAFEEIDGKMMVNATQMTKPFKQRPVEWLKTQQAQDLLNAMSKVRNLTLADLQIVKRGGNNPGTWFHEEVALLFAQWLSPEFYIACNRKLKQLLTQQSLQLPAKYGVPPTVHEGELLYPYGKACELLGGVQWPKATARRRRNPEHFRKVYGRNFITAAYLDLLKGYYDYKKMSNQLSLAL